jgi:WD40 repeat protein
LILLACPEAFETIGAEDKSWVEEEFLYWCTKCGGRNKVLVAKTAGDIHWGHAGSGIDWATTTSIPSRLKEYLSPNPVVIDLSWARQPENRTRLALRDPKFANAVAALAEPIYGKDREELFSEDGRQRRTAIILRNFAIAGLVLLAMIASVFGVLATKNQALAERRSQLNISERLAAESELTRQRFPQRSALFAAEAIRVARAADVNVPGAEDAARRALEAFYGSRPIRHPGLATMAVSPDGRWLATGGSDRLIKLWDLTDIEAPPKVLEGHTTTPSQILFSKDGHWLISAGEYWGRGVIAKGEDRRALLWSMATLSQSPSAPAKQITPEILKGTGVPIQLAFSPAGDLATVLFADGRILICALQADHPCDTADPRSWLNPIQEAKTLAFDPTGHWLAVGYRDGTARLWSRATLMSSRDFAVLSGHDDPVVYALSFSPDGQWLATLSADQQSDSGAPPTTTRSARLWSMASIEPNARPVGSIIPIRSTYHRVWEVTFSPDSQWLLMRGETPDLRLWRVQHGGVPDRGFDLQGEAADQFDNLASAAFSPYSTLVATGSSSGAVRIWRIQSGAPVAYRSLARAVSGRVESVGVPNALKM